MKKYLWILISLFLLSGCSSSVPEMLPEDFDNSGEKYVLYCGEKSFVLSDSVDGTHNIGSGPHWYYELAWQKNVCEDLFYTYDLKNHELNGSKAADRLENCFATNGNWPLFLYPVHTEYSSSNQSEVEPALLAVAEGEVTDVWECDLNGDGASEQLFCAAGDKKFFGYCRGEDFQGIYSGSCETVEPLICDLNGDAVWELVLYLKDSYECFCVFEFADNSFVKRYEIFF